MPIYRYGERVPSVHESVFVAPNASVIGSVVLAENVSVWFGATIRGDNDVITLGKNSNVQEGAVLHTDPGIKLTVGENVTIGHQAMLHGCTIGDGTLVGIKSVVLNDAVIGRNCVIGANSLIAEGKKIPDGSLVLGSPGKVVRQLTEDEIKRFNGISANYVRKWKLYKTDLKPDLS